MQGGTTALVGGTPASLPLTSISAKGAARVSKLPTISTPRPSGCDRRVRPEHGRLHQTSAPAIGSRRELCAPNMAIPSEQEALYAFSGGEQYCELIPKALDKLGSAAPPNTSVPPGEVKGAMAFLELMRDQKCPDLPGFRKSGEALLAQLEGNWQLHFSTISDVFPYIPVDESLVIDTQSRVLKVVNNFGPLVISLESPFEFSGTSCEFGFDTVVLLFLGNEFFRKSLKSRKMKWYNFYYTDDRFSCVRSSSGALTLLFRIDTL